MAEDQDRDSERPRITARPLLSEQSKARLALRFAEAHLLVEEGRFEASLVECRKLGELISKALLARSEHHRGASEPQALSLQRTAHLLEKRGELPAFASASLIALQPLGNLGAHDQGDDVEPSASSARAACAASGALVEWLWRHEGYEVDLLRHPGLLEGERKARWIIVYDQTLAGLLSVEGVARAEREVGRATRRLRWLLVSWVTFGVALMIMASSKEQARPVQEGAGLTLKLSPDRSVFELGEQVSVALMTEANAEIELGALTLNGPQFERLGAQLRAVSSGRAQLTACGAHGEGCISRELMVLLP